MHISRTYITNYYNKKKNSWAYAKLVGLLVYLLPLNMNASLYTAYTNQNSWVSNAHLLPQGSYCDNGVKIFCFRKKNPIAYFK